MTRVAPGYHYEFEDLGDGVAFGRARAEGTGLSNTGVIRLDESPLIFDTSLTLHSAREIRTTCRTLTGREPALSVNSHWHFDHVLGNQVFADRPIYASRRTAEILLEKRAEMESELTREKLESEIRELERQQASCSTESGRARFDAVLRVNRTLLEEVVELKLVYPTERFEAELALPGGLGARLLNWGAGHTESDTVLYLAKSRILFAGDLVVAGTHPNLTSGDPEHWLTVLKKIEELRPERIVPGHGPLSTADQLSVMKDYLSTIIELAHVAGEPEMPQRFRSWTEPDQFVGNLAYARARSSSNGRATPR